MIGQQICREMVWSTRSKRLPVRRSLLFLVAAVGKGGRRGRGSQKKPQDFEGTEQIIEFFSLQNVARDFLSRALDNVQLDGVGML